MMNKKRFLLQMLTVTAFVLMGLEASAQLVDRATFEQHLAKARSLSSQRKAAAASSPITLTQNPFEIEEFNISRRGTCDVKVYFNTAVMAAYRSECCPRITEFELALPNGFSVTSVKRGNDLQQSPITVTGAFDDDTKTLSFLGYGVCSAAELAQLPTGRIHYATITISSSNATVGDYLLNMSEARFAMADEPSEFTISGTTNYPFHYFILATGISLNKTYATIYDGTTLQLVASISPSNTTNKTIAWSSSDTSVATVSSNGLVTALKPGTATITVTTQDGSNLSATCQLTVQKQLATSITLSQNSLEIGIGATATLVATVLPENTTDKRVMWTSSNTAIASVAAGMVQGNSMGECIITATTLDGSDLSATCHVVVTNGGGTQQGDNYLAADDIDDVVAGQEFVIPVALVNEAPITALMFDLQLPNGIILPNYNEDDVFVTLDADRQGRGHSVSTTETALAVRVVASSSRNAAFKGNSGNVLYIALRMADNVPSGTYGIDLRNVFMTTTDEQEIEAPNVKINIGAVDYHSGDANGDGYVDDVDYAITVRYILAQNPTNFVFNAADMSGDGRINITDLPMIVNAAMAYDFGTYNAPLRAPAQASANNKMYVNDFDLAGNATKTLNIVLDNATAFNAVQCDIEVPDGLTIVEQTDEWGDLAYALPVSSRMNNHDTWTDLTGSGNVRLIIANSNNNALKGTSGAVANFKVRSAAGFSGEHELVLKNIVCADANAVRYALPDAVCLINHSANLPGDIDGNGAVNGTDLNILINIILGKDNAANYNGRANVNDEGGVDGTDLNKLINIILGK